MVPSNRTMTLESTQPLVKMSTRDVQPAGAWGWRPHHLHVPNVTEIWEPKPPGTPWATPGLLRDAFTFIYTHIYIYIPFDADNWQTRLFVSLCWLSLCVTIQIGQRLFICLVKKFRVFWNPKFITVHTSVFWRGPPWATSIQATVPCPI